MGFRFQKRISILPGVRLNLSKSGASWSVGPRGASVNIGKRGIYGTVGIPGTGLSYRERLDKPRNRANPSPAPSGPEMPDRVIARLVGDEVLLLDEQERPLDQTLVPEAKRLMRGEIEPFLDRHAADRNASTEALREMHHDIPLAIGTVESSDHGKPNRDHYYDHQSYMQALMQWRAAQANAGPDEGAIGDALLERLGALEWPAETNIALDYRAGRLLLDVDLPEIEDMPGTVWKASFTRMALEAKAMTKKDLAALYLDHVCSVLLRLVGHAFAACPDIGTVALSAYTQRSGATGSLSDEYVATLELDRARWKSVDATAITRIDPHQCLRQLGARLETNSRGTLLVQQPLN